MPTDDGHYSNQELPLALIPHRNSGLPRNTGLLSLYRFAITFCRMYEVVGGASQCVEIRERTRTAPRPTLTELRTALLATLRGWRFNGRIPTDEEVDYLWGLAEKIRDRVAAGEFE
jgi:hypothetical protein